MQQGIKSTILRSNSGMVRDCWIEEDTVTKGEKILVLRQLKFGPDGTEPVCKQIRLTAEEIKIVLNVLGCRTAEDLNGRNV